MDDKMRLYNTFFFSSDYPKEAVKKNDVVQQKKNPTLHKVIILI